MIMSWIFPVIMLVSIICALVVGNGSALSTAIPQGAQAGITLAISMAGSICLWTAVGKLMEACGITAQISRFLKPLLNRVFPTTQKDRLLANRLSANICANFLGLGNAATPMGIQAAQRLAGYAKDGSASDELCRLIVLNTASIQLLPTTVAAIRSGLGSHSPFDILPAVWITSIASVTAGLCAAFILGKIWRK